MQAVQRYFSFAEIVQGRDASVRVTHDGLLYAVDLVMVVTEKNRDEAGMVLRRIPEDVFLSINLIERKMQGRGNAHTKLVTFQNAIKLVMVLPGHVASEVRTQFASIINRYLAGDHTLISEIQSNAESTSPVAQMARESLGISTEEDLRRKRLREDLELQKLQVEIEDRKRQSDNNKRQSAIDFVHSYADTMSLLDSDWKKDQRIVVQLKDYLANATMGPKQLTNNSDDEAIYVTMVAKDMGYNRLSHGQDCKIGREMAKLYRAKYGVEPQTCKRLVNGTEMVVKHYTKRDLDIMQRAIKSAME